jgi:hypothetical protein
MSDVTSKREATFANVASWICLVSSFIIPIGFKSAFTSPYLPESRDGECGVLLLFVVGQVIAVALGVKSIILARREKWRSVFDRCICGIVIGCIAAVVMALFALSYEIGL